MLILHAHDRLQLLKAVYFLLILGIARNDTWLTHDVWQLQVREVCFSGFRTRWGLLSIRDFDAGQELILFGLKAFEMVPGGKLEILSVFMNIFNSLEVVRKLLFDFLAEIKSAKNVEIYLFINLYYFFVKFFVVFKKNTNYLPFKSFFILFVFIILFSRTRFLIVKWEVIFWLL